VYLMVAPDVSVVTVASFDVMEISGVTTPDVL
jgi:hypothetical protein